jgi:urate oxidase
MSALFTFEQIKKALANTSMPLVCVIVITLLTTSCATVPTKQTTSTDTTANSLTTKEKSNNETSKEIMKKIACREVVATGTTIKRTVCEFKETWDEISKEKGKKADELIREVTRQSGIIPEGTQNSGQGRVNSAVTPPGGGF